MRIQIAYSPDSDDAFMMGPLVKGAIDSKGFDLEFFREDIQELNHKAISEQPAYDVTAISIAAYPFMQKNYRMIDVGASIGDDYGPSVMVHQSKKVQKLDDLKGLRIAVPGLQTSTYFAAKICFPENEFVPMSFLDILPAIKDKRVDAGILIHELQMLSCEFAQKKFDLGKVWQQKTSLPLPLGTNAIRRSLGEEVHQKLHTLLLESVDYALANREEYLAYIQAVGDKEFAWSKEQDDAYINRYVNANSREFTPIVKNAIDYMFEQAAGLGICPKVDKEGLRHEC